MELANIAFHIENSPKRSILGRRWRKCNMKEKLDNLHNENRGKRVILWKFLNDGQTHKGFNPVHTDREDSVNSAEDCESMSYESHSLNGYESKTTLNQAQLFDDGFCCDSLSSSGSSSALSDWLKPGLIREAGDGTETPDYPRCLSNRGARKRLQTRVTGTEPCHVDGDRSMEYSNSEWEYSCTLRLFAEPEEQSTSSAHGRGVTSPMISKSTYLHSDHGRVSSTDVNNEDCIHGETNQRKQCNVLALTKLRLRHYAKSNLKKLMKLYKARKFGKKQRSTEHVKSIGSSNAENTDECNSCGSSRLASTSGPSLHVIHEDMCQTLGLDNRNVCCAPDRDIVRQVCESTEKNDIVSNRLFAEFYDCDGLDLAVDCYCSETDELAYLNNGFMMD